MMNIMVGQISAILTSPTRNDILFKVDLHGVVRKKLSFERPPVKREDLKACPFNESTW